jgi:hypothetical protein
LETQKKLAARVADRFPGSGLSELSAELVKIVQEAAARAEHIRRPNWLLRIAVALLALGALGFALPLLASLELKVDLKNAMGLFQVGEAALRACFFFGAAVLFLVSLEVRMKRRRALAALHELRTMAHIIDMHQIAKDPDGLLRSQGSSSATAKETTKTPFELNRYLNYCNELLSIISKVAALYVQDFPDGPTVAAANQVEQLCAGLAQKIWQKIMVLDKFVERPAARRSHSRASSSFDPTESSPSATQGEQQGRFFTDGS